MIQALSRSIFIKAFAATLALSFSLQGSAHPNPPGCQEAAAAVKVAQSEYAVARSAWYAADGHVRTQENKIAFLKRQLAINFKEQGKALLELDSVKKDKADCNYWQSNPDSPAPLTDCEKVPARMEAAQKKVDELEQAGSDLNSELDSAEAQLEVLEDERAEAHRKEREADAALKAAKDAWAALGCHPHA